jgi:A/G-specific adenine glycosylase
MGRAIRAGGAGTPMAVVAEKQLQLRLPGPQTVAALLAWYGRERRDLPWRAKGRRRPDPYRVWLSEIMLQQTTVKAVIPYYAAFLARWPTLEALAAAPLDDVLAAWAGLGYYSRARNLHKCAGVVVARHGGRFPASEAELLELPGIGPYTAAAIAAIAFARPVVPVDANIERVMARVFAIGEPLKAAKGRIRRLAQTFACGSRSGDCAQALMDLGASVCSPRAPACLMCPISGDCAAHARGIEGEVPVRSGAPERPLRKGLAFVALREDGAVLLRRRPEAGLLGGMLEVPSTDWGEALPQLKSGLRSAPVQGEWWAVPGMVAHVFTHFRLELKVYRALVPAHASLTLWSDPARCRWVLRRDLSRAALPSVMRKVIAHALSEQ